MPRLSSRPVDEAREMAPGLREAPPPGGHRSRFVGALRAPLTAANTVGPRAALAVACSIAATCEGASPAEPMRAERRGQRRAERTLEAEFKPLYDVHFQLVWRALSRLGVREADLMDLTQKVFLTAYLRMPQFDGRTPVATWLRGICRRVATRYRRSGAIRYEITSDPVRLDVSIERRAAAESEADPNRRVTVEHLLSKLSEKQRIAFTLFEVVELSAPEVAALLNVSHETVRSRLRCARKRCRREARRLGLVSASAKTKAP